MPHDDYEKYYETRVPKGRRRRSEKLAARDLVRRLSWLENRPLYWGGAPVQEPDVVIPECRPLGQLLTENLRGRAAGLFAVELSFADEAGRRLQPKVGDLHPVTSRSLSDASWLLSLLPQKERELSRLVGDAAAWREKLYRRLHRYSAVFQAIGPEQTENAEGLTIEALCGWIGSSRLRPSRLLPNHVLEDHLDPLAGRPSPSQQLAAVLLGRRPHARVPDKLLAYKSLGQLLKTWSPDLLALVCRNVNIRRLLALVQEWPELNRPEWAGAIREYQLLAAEPDVDGLLRDLPAVLAAWKRIEQEPRNRRQRILELFGCALQEHPHYLTVAGRQRRWNRDFDHCCRQLLTARLQASGIAVEGVGRKRDPIRVVCRWLIGIELPDDMLSFVRDLNNDDVDPSYALMQRLESVLTVRRKPPRPAALAMAALLGRIAARTGSNQATGAFASWLDHCRRHCLPGAAACGPVRLATAALAASLDRGDGEPGTVERTISLAGLHGDLMLQHISTRVGGNGRPPTCEELAKRFLEDGILAALAAVPELYEDYVPLLFEAHLADWLLRIFNGRPAGIETAMAFLAEADDEWYSLPAYSRATWAELFQIEDQHLARRLALWTVELARTDTCNWDDLVYLLEDILRFVQTGGGRAQQDFLRRRFELLEEILNTAVRIVRRARKQDSWPVVDVFSWRTTLIEIAFHWERLGHPDVEDVISQLNLACDRQDEQLLANNVHEPQPYFATGVDVELSVLLSGGSAERLQNCLNNSPQQTYPYPANSANSWRFLDQHPTVQRFLSRMTERTEFIIRVKLMLQRLALALRLQSTYALHNDLSQWENIRTAPGAEIPPHTPAGCVPAMQALLAWHEYLHPGRKLPKSIRKILDRPSHLRAELTALERKTADKQLSPTVAARLANVQHYLEDPDALADWIERDLSKELDKHLGQWQLEALERVVARAIERHWKLLNPAIDIHNDANWDNALLLGLTVSQNRRLLKELLRMTASAEPDWFRRHPVNQRFLETVAAGGVDPAVWMGRFQRSREQHGETWTIYLEDDPLLILQMGNLFDTCLSVGGGSAYSTVANAIEANKRVVYVCNSRGHIIGRKLLAMDRGGRIYGFNSYGRGIWNKIALDQYCSQLARQAGARLATPEDIANLDPDDLRLFADWYFDGCEPFDWYAVAGFEREQLQEDLRQNFPKRWHADEIAVVRALLVLGADALAVIDRHRAKLPRHTLRRLRRESHCPQVREYLEPFC